METQVYCPDTTGSTKRKWRNKGAKPLPPVNQLMFQFYVLNGKLSCQLYHAVGECFWWCHLILQVTALMTMNDCSGFVIASG